MAVQEREKMFLSDGHEEKWRAQRRRSGNGSKPIWKIKGRGGREMGTESTIFERERERA